jgi:hypothetical protein
LFIELLSNRIIIHEDDKSLEITDCDQYECEFNICDTIIRISEKILFLGKYRIIQTHELIKLTGSGIELLNNHKIHSFFPLTEIKLSELRQLIKFQTEYSDASEDSEESDK